MRRLLVAACLLAVCGCGKKTPPLPAAEIIPPAVTDLAFHLDEGGVTLTWSAPPGRGKDLRPVVSGYEINRAVFSPDQACDSCPLPWGRPVHIDERDARSELPGRHRQYREAVLRPGLRYAFRIRPLLGRLMTGPFSNTVAFTWETPLSAPQGLTVSPGDGRLDLVWQPVTSALDGTPVLLEVRYQVLRAAGDWRFRPVAEDLRAASFQDSTVANGVTYRYRVRAIRQVSGAAIAGPVSAEVPGVAADHTPPALPADLVVQAEPEGILLSWPASPAADLAGYRIYRVQLPATDPTLLGEVPAGTESYFDHPAPGAGRWQYGVTAFDRATPANESAAAFAVLTVGPVSTE
ncbi:MAG: fibronectin type III domain-containing protein [Thermodesulfobacteriota bacterium]